MIDKEEIARTAATTWCRCFKCDEEVKNLISENSPAVKFKCDKKTLSTCHKWYDSYRTSLIAIDMVYDKLNLDILYGKGRVERISLK